MSDRSGAVSSDAVLCRRLLASAAAVPWPATPGEIVEWFERAARTLPGVATTALCLGGPPGTVQQKRIPECADCSTPASGSGPSNPPRCQLSDQPGFLVFPLETSAKSWGWLVLRPEQPSFTPEQEGLFRDWAVLAGLILQAAQLRERDEDQKRFASRMLETQKLESLGVLAGGIAHDFNNLLVGVLGYSSLALAELPSTSSVRPHVEQIERAAKRAAELTGQMLTYSGKGRFVAGPLQLNDLVRDISGLLEMSISKKARLELNKDPGLPRIMADAAQIRQVLINLVLNASEALGTGAGLVCVRTGTEPMDRNRLREFRHGDELPEGLYVVLEVGDTGSGMDPAVLSRIFDPFFSTKFTGRGLGLPVVEGILRSHGGAIKVDSAPGRGTRFTLLFPPLEKSQIPEIPEEKPLPPPPTILIADDEPLVRNLAERVLLQAGFRVVLAMDGQQAVEIFRARRGEISLVLLDAAMPKLSGEEAFREIRHLEADIPVLLSSGYLESDAAGTLLSEGLTGFLQKPYTADILLEKVRNTLVK